MPKKVSKKGRASRGRPSKFDARFIDEAKKLAMLGATDEEMADFWGVSVPTLHGWRKQHRAFFKSTHEGKLIADAEVASSLYSRAIGHQHAAVKIFMPSGAEEPVYAPYTERYPPDTTAASLWLRNRQPTRWRDKTEVAAEVNVNDITPPSPLDDARRTAFHLEQARRLLLAGNGSPRANSRSNGE